MALFGLAVWYLSLHSLLDRHNQLGADASRQNWQSQILQLQQKQRLWLQSQYYLLDRLVERGTKPTQFQAVLWDYYQTNPGIRAVSLVYFDEQGQPVPIGLSGELYIGGLGLSKGYWNRPELTDARFLPNPFGDGHLYRTGDRVRWNTEGNIEFLGRKDQRRHLVAAHQRKTAVAGLRLQMTLRFT